MARNTRAMTNQTSLANVLNQVATISCVSCSEPYDYDMCPHNPQSVYFARNDLMKTQQSRMDKPFKFFMGGNQQWQAHGGGHPQQENRGTPSEFHQGNQGHQQLHHRH